MIEKGMYWSASAGRRLACPRCIFSDKRSARVKLGARRKSPVSRKVVSLSLAFVLSTLFSLENSQQSFGATPYEAQIGGFITASLQTLITGEFAGLSPSNADADLNRPVCRPADYSELRAAANDRSALDSFRRKCRLIQLEIDENYVHGIAHLPVGYCVVIKDAVDKEVVSRVNSESAHSPRDLIIEYKGAIFESTDRLLARGARLQAKCQEDGSLRVSAPRRRR